MMRLRIPFISTLLFGSDGEEVDGKTSAATAASSASSSSSLHPNDLEGGGAAGVAAATHTAYHQLRAPAASSSSSPTRPLLSGQEGEADFSDACEYEQQQEEESEIEDMEVFRAGRFAFSLTVVLFATLSVALLTAGALLFSTFLGKTLMGAGAALVGILVLMLLCGGEREREEEGEEAGSEASAIEAERRALLLDRKQMYSPRSGGGVGGCGGGGLGVPAHGEGE